MLGPTRHTFTVPSPSQANVRATLSIPANIAAGGDGVRFGNAFIGSQTVNVRLEDASTVGWTGIPPQMRIYGINVRRVLS